MCVGACITAENHKSGKRRGRPRKADQKVEKPRYSSEEKNEPEIGGARRGCLVKCQVPFSYLNKMPNSF